MDTSQNQYIDNFKIAGNWEQQCNELKKQFPLLTDDDVKYEVGCEDDLLIRIANKLNIKKEEVITLIKKGQPEFSHALKWINQ